MKKKNIREMVDKIQSNNDRINEIANVLETEKREMNEKEQTEYKELCRENQLLEMQMRTATADFKATNPNALAEAEKMLRSNAANGRKTEIVFVRDIVTVADAQSGALIPVNIQDVVKPLQEGTILDKVGLPLMTGLVGDFVWPCYEMIEATIAGEGVALADTTIEFSKLSATPERIGVAIPVSRESLNQTNGLLETIIREIMPQAVTKLLNKIICSPNKVTGATHLVGPFVGLKATAVELSAVPTFKELNTQLKAALLESGVDGDHVCYTMTKSMASILEGTPINAQGVYMPILQDGKIAGVPVFTSNDMRDSEGNEYIGIGDWRYQPMGLFGTASLIVDPYSKARNNAVDFVFNVNYATKTLRQDAFKLGVVATA